MLKIQKEYSEELRKKHLTTLESGNPFSLAFEATEDDVKNASGTERSNETKKKENPKNLAKNNKTLFSTLADKTGTGTVGGITSPTSGSLRVMGSEDLGTGKSGRFGRRSGFGKS
jgi:hypothetical protein